MGVVSLRVVVPVFGYTHLLSQLHGRLTSCLEPLVDDLGFVYVLDGGAALSWPDVAAVAESDGRVLALHLGRNYGQQACLAVGMEQCRGHWVVVLDGDLQDPPELVADLLERAESGPWELVMTARRQTGQAWWRSFLGGLFHSLLLGVWNPPRYACFSLAGPGVVERYLRDARRFQFYVKVMLETRVLHSVLYYDRKSGQGTTYSLPKLVRMAVKRLWLRSRRTPPLTVEIAERLG